MNKYEKHMTNLPSLADLAGYWIGIDDAIRLGEAFVPLQPRSVARLPWLRMMKRGFNTQFIQIAPPSIQNEDDIYGICRDPYTQFILIGRRMPPMEIKHISKCPAWQHYRKGGKFREQV